jgi:hypothetical protein
VRGVRTRTRGLPSNIGVTHSAVSGQRVHFLADRAAKARAAAPNEEEIRLKVESERVVCVYLITYANNEPHCT